MQAKFLTPFLILILTFLGSSSLLAEEVESIPLELKAKQPKQGLMEDISWLLMAGDDAYNMGFLPLAEKFYNRILSFDGLSESLRKEINLKLVSVAIAKQDYITARKRLSQLKQAGSSLYYLQNALVALHDGEMGQVKRYIRLVRPEGLLKVELPWYYLVSGLYQAKLGKNDEAEKWFQKALKSGIEDTQLSLFESVILREKIFSGHVSEQMLKELSGKLNEAALGDEGYEWVRQYAVLLDGLGRKEEALELVAKYINEYRALNQNVDQLLLLQGYIAGPESEKGRMALQQLLKGNTSRGLQAMAMRMLASAQVGERDLKDVQRFFDNLIQEYSNHPLRDELYMMRALLARKVGDFSQAGKDVDTILDEFPGSPLTASALKLKAYLAWENKPPQYRIVADLLRKVRQIEAVSGEERAQLAVLMGDSYFLNGDYKNASDIYGVAINEYVTLSQPVGPIMFQQIMSDLKLNDLKQAIQHLDLAVSMEMDPAYRWKAEWSVMSVMKKSGMLKDAFDRIEHLLKGADEESLPLELRLRLMWLKAQLAYDSGNYEDVPFFIDNTIGLIKHSSTEEYPKAQMDELASQVLFLKAKALLAQGDEKAGLAVWRELREKYAQQESSILSYLEESRYYASLDRTVEGLQKCVELADKYPSSVYAPIALYEAAQLAQLRGQMNSLEKALSLLERLATDYPKHELLYYARLEQADVLRAMNKFGAALLVYESLLAQYPNHPERSITELNRAKCLFSLSSKDAEKGDLAIAQFEQLFDLPNLAMDLRIEAGYHWAFALTDRGDVGRSQEVLWMLITRFLVNTSDKNAYTFKGRYWLARSIFDLGEHFEQKGEFEDAHSTYALIKEFDLPGRALAQAKLEKFGG